MLIGSTLGESKSFYLLILLYVLPFYACVNNWCREFVTYICKLGFLVPNSIALIIFSFYLGGWHNWPNTEA